MKVYITALIRDGQELDQIHTIYETCHFECAAIKNAKAEADADAGSPSITSRSWVEVYDPAKHTCTCGGVIPGPMLEYDEGVHVEPYTRERWLEIVREMDNRVIGSGLPCAATAETGQQSEQAKRIQKASLN